MLSAERRKRLVRLVREEGVAQVNELAERLGASASTIRRDLTGLQAEGLLTRTHGGALAPDGPLEAERQVRQREHSTQKQRLATAAGRYISPGSTVLVTGGTTTESLVPVLAEIADLTVVTNSLTIASALADHDRIDVVVLGGYLRRGEMSLLGHLTQQMLGELSLDQAFVSTYGVDRRGLTGAHVMEADTDRYLLRAAPIVSVLADSSKFAVRGPVRTAGPERMNRLITNADAPPDEVEALRSTGVEVVLV